MAGKIKIHYYLFKYSDTQSRWGKGPNVHEACKDAFGTLYGPDSEVKYKYFAARRPTTMSAGMRKALYDMKNGWNDIPKPESK